MSENNITIYLGKIGCESVGRTELLYQNCESVGRTEMLHQNCG